MGSAALRATQLEPLGGRDMAHDGCTRGGVLVRRLGCYGETVAASIPSERGTTCAWMILRVTTHAARTVAA
jgi:hypothetical protein